MKNGLILFSLFIILKILPAHPESNDHHPPLVFIDQEKFVLIREHDTTVLPCNNDAHPLASSSWFKNDIQIVRNITHSFRIFDATRADGGYYHCVSTNSIGASRSPKFKLEVGYFDSIDHKLPRVFKKVQLGDSVTIKPIEGIEATELKSLAHPSPRASWTINNSPVNGRSSSSRYYQSPLDHSLTILNVDRSLHLTVIRASLFNGYGTGKSQTETSGSLTQSYIIEVIDPPPSRSIYSRSLDLVIAPKDAEVILTDGKIESARFECVFNARPSSHLHVEWFVQRQSDTTHWLVQDQPEHQDNISFTFDKLGLNRTLTIGGLQLGHSDLLSDSLITCQGRLESSSRSKTYNDYDDKSQLLSTTARLRLLTAPRIEVSTMPATRISRPARNVLIVEQAASTGVELACEMASKGSPPMDNSPEWLFNGRVIDFILMNGRFHRSNANNSLIIGDLNVADAGVYQCYAYNEVGEDFLTYWLKVSSFAPTLSTTNSTTTTSHLVKALQGNPQTSLDCPIDAAPLPTYRWYKKHPRDNGWHPMTSLLSDSNENRILFLTNVTKHDVGTYMCSAENDLGQASYEMQLQVVSPTYRLNPDRARLSLRSGDHMKLVCSVMSEVTEPPNIPQFNWVYEYRSESSTASAKTPRDEWAGSVSNSRLHVTFVKRKPSSIDKQVLPVDINSTSTEELIETNFLVYSSILELGDVRYTDSGIYLCDVQSEGGNLSTAFEVVVLSEPLASVNLNVALIPPATSLDCSNRLGIKQHNNMCSTNIQFTFHDSSNHARSVRRRALAVSRYLLFSAAVANGNLACDDKAIDWSIARKIYTSYSDSTTVNDTLVKLSAVLMANESAGQLQFKMPLTDLTGCLGAKTAAISIGGQCCFKLAAINSIGWGPTSSTTALNLSTLINRFVDDVGQEMSDHFDYHTSTTTYSDSIEIIWTPNHVMATTATNLADAFFEYKISYSPSNLTDRVQHIQASNWLEPIRITDLLPCTSYNIQVARCLARHCSEYGRPITAITKPLLPSEPSSNEIDFHLVTVSTTSAMIQIGAISRPTLCPLTHYKLTAECIDPPGCANQSTLTKLDNTSPTLIELTNLLPNALYELRLASVNQAGLGPSSTWSELIRTQAEAPGPVEDLQVEQIDPVFPWLRVSWKPPSSLTRSGPLKGYVIKHWQVPKKTLTDNNVGANRAINDDDNITTLDVEAGQGQARVAVELIDLEPDSIIWIIIEPRQNVDPRHRKDDNRRADVSTMAHVASRPPLSPPITASFLVELCSWWFRQRRQSMTSERVASWNDQKLASVVDLQEVTVKRLSDRPFIDSVENGTILFSSQLELQIEIPDDPQTSSVESTSDYIKIVQRRMKQLLTNANWPVRVRRLPPASWYVSSTITNGGQESRSTNKQSYIDDVDNKEWQLAECSQVKLLHKSLVKTTTNQSAFITMRYQLGLSIIGTHSSFLSLQLWLPVESLLVGALRSDDGGTQLLHSRQFSDWVRVDSPNFGEDDSLDLDNIKLTVFELTSRSVRLTWQPMFTSPWRVNEPSYQLRYEKIPQLSPTGAASGYPSPTSHQPIQINASQFYCLITGLDPGTSYRFLLEPIARRSIRRAGIGEHVMGDRSPAIVQSTVTTWFETLTITSAIFIKHIGLEMTDSLSSNILYWIWHQFIDQSMNRIDSFKITASISLVDETASSESNSLANGSTQLEHIIQLDDVRLDTTTMGRKDQYRSQFDLTPLVERVKRYFGCVNLNVDLSVSPRMRGGEFRADGATNQSVRLHLPASLSSGAGLLRLQSIDIDAVKNYPHGSAHVLIGWQPLRWSSSNKSRLYLTWSPVDPIGLIKTVDNGQPQVNRKQLLFPPLGSIEESLVSIDNLSVGATYKFAITDESAKRDECHRRDDSSHSLIIHISATNMSADPAYLFRHPPSPPFQMNTPSLLSDNTWSQAWIPTTESCSTGPPLTLAWSPYRPSSLIGPAVGQHQMAYSPPAEGYTLQLTRVMDESEVVNQLNWTIYHPSPWVGQETGFHVMGLLADAVYRFRLSVKTPEATSNFGPASRPIRTPSVRPCAAPSGLRWHHAPVYHSPTFSPDESGCNRIVLSWQIIKNDQWNGRPRYYRVTLQEMIHDTTSSTGQNSHLLQVENSETKERQELVLDQSLGIKSFTFYSVFIEAWNPHGSGPRSSNLFLSTGQLCQLPPTQPVNETESSALVELQCRPQPEPAIVCRWKHKDLTGHLGYRFEIMRLANHTRTTIDHSTLPRGPADNSTILTLPPNATAIRLFSLTRLLASIGQHDRHAIDIDHYAIEQARHHMDGRYGLELLLPNSLYQFRLTLLLTRSLYDRNYQLEDRMITSIWPTKDENVSSTAYPMGFYCTHDILPLPPPPPSNLFLTWQSRQTVHLSWNHPALVPLTTKESRITGYRVIQLVDYYQHPISSNQVNGGDPVAVSNSMAVYNMRQVGNVVDIQLDPSNATTHQNLTVQLVKDPVSADSSARRREKRGRLYSLCVSSTSSRRAGKDNSRHYGPAICQLIAVPSHSIPMEPTSKSVSITCRPHRVDQVVVDLSSLQSTGQSTTSFFFQLTAEPVCSKQRLRVRSPIVYKVSSSSFTKSNVANRDAIGIDFFHQSSGSPSMNPTDQHLLKLVWDVVVVEIERRDNEMNTDHKHSTRQYLVEARSSRNLSTWYSLATVDAPLLSSVSSPTTSSSYLINPDDPLFKAMVTGESQDDETVANSVVDNDMSQQQIANVFSAYQQGTSSFQREVAVQFRVVPVERNLVGQPSPGSAWIIVSADYDQVATVFHTWWFPVLLGLLLVPIVIALVILIRSTVQHRRLVKTSIATTGLLSTTTKYLNNTSNQFGLEVIDQFCLTNQLHQPSPSRMSCEYATSGSSVSQQRYSPIGPHPDIQARSFCAPLASTNSQHFVTNTLTRTGPPKLSIDNELALTSFVDNASLDSSYHHHQSSPFDGYLMSKSQVLPPRTNNISSPPSSSPAHHYYTSMFPVDNILLDTPSSQSRVRSHRLHHHQGAFYDVELVNQTNPLLNDDQNGLRTGNDSNIPCLELPPSLCDHQKSGYATLKAAARGRYQLPDPSQLDTFMSTDPYRRKHFASMKRCQKSKQDPNFTVTSLEPTSKLTMLNKCSVNKHNLIGTVLHSSTPDGRRGQCLLANNDDDEEDQVASTQV